MTEKMLQIMSETSITWTLKPARESTKKMTTDLTHVRLDVPKSQVTYYQIKSSMVLRGDRDQV